MDNKLYFDVKHSETIFDAIKAERKSVGFYDLPERSVEDILEFSSQVEQREIVVVGIGGSALGALAVYKFLRPVKKFEKRLHFLDTTDPIVLSRKLDNIDIDDAFFVVISKSGTTIEMVSVLKYLLSIVPISSDRYVAITDSGSRLDSFAKSKNLRVFHVPSNVGGRFSVLSAVGLVPLALVGVDIRALLSGANIVKESFFTRSSYCDTLLNKATYYAQFANTYNINCLFSYSELFREFNAWFVQLWGESLGKEQLHSELHVGLTPVGLIGPTDQHSFLQLIVDGKRDKSVTVIKIKEFNHSLQIPDISLEYLEESDILNTHPFSNLINLQADSMVESLEQLKTIPLDVIEIEDVSEKSIGELIYYYELLTAMVAKMLDINAYDQPGVESGKAILKKKIEGKK